MTRTILPDTTLCAIVRDEITNPAGGIKKFCGHSLPFVEEAVIVDTGSNDGTQEELEGLAVTYGNLRVFNRQFDNFSNSRNFSLAQARTKYILILDADERLSESDFAYLRNFLDSKPIKPPHFRFLEIFPGYWQEATGGFTTRLFPNLPETHFWGELYELLSAQDLTHIINEKLEIAIKHFLPTRESHGDKQYEWYSYLREHYKTNWKLPPKAPSECTSFPKWKEYDPTSELIYEKVKDWEQKSKN